MRITKLYAKNSPTLSLLFQACTEANSLVQLHCQLLKTGLSHNTFLNTKLVSLYAKFKRLFDARQVFDEIPQRNIYLWNAMLRGYCRERKWQETLELFSQMERLDVKPDNYSVPIAIKACAGLSAIRLGRKIHEKIMGSWVIADMFVGSALIELYAKCGEMEEARCVFSQFSKPDVVLWTSMVTGYEQNGQFDEALNFFSLMQERGPRPDTVTLVSALSACTQCERNIKDGKCFHGYIIRRGFETDLPLINALLNFYAKSGSMKLSKKVFDNMNERDVVSWGAMINGYVYNEQAAEALGIYREMLEKDIEPNSVTSVGALQACAIMGALRDGQRIHDSAIRNGFESDLAFSTALIDMYMKCGCFELGLELFNQMPVKDTVTWAAVISGYAQNGLAKESLGVFREMLMAGILPDAVTMVKVLASTAQLGLVQQALCLHSYLIKTGFEEKPFVGASLIDLYSKCGSLECGVRLFEAMREKDVVVWSAMTAGFGIHGSGAEAIQLFNKMCAASIVPNNVTFVSVLSACSHSGLIQEGFDLFDVMVHKYGIVPDVEHYACMVDLLGRTGNLKKAMDFVEMLPIKAGPQVWGALLGACRIHGNVELGELAAKKLFESEPNHGGYYVLLSNIYAVGGRWGDVGKVRRLMRDKGLRKTPGYSSIEIKNVVSMFLAGDKLHAQSEEICRLLGILMAEMRERGYEPDTSFLMHGMEDEREILLHDLEEEREIFGGKC
ncbi:putative pentatricopeptide repeat-containing protein At3g01580 [Amborella trichopoda]|uniref:putative pentatricopeptide repeat-containing protein At3g01580 n=1 Tax=Amborella trichopoda TaxID=13333 RepID=UPI0005D394DC|nr:putative pentatricopeptide repeat-containing protein At3g01580 [Amborella trichopoda]|eukprot:XP_011626246.1 putative pentatricopeptide repeat-containing protein At3g01580 [Amborella trichopoda]